MSLLVLTMLLRWIVSTLGRWWTSWVRNLVSNRWSAIMHTLNLAWLLREDCCCLLVTDLSLFVLLDQITSVLR
jgi:hypothetical protein